MSSITLTNTTKKFGEFTAVRDMNLSIKNGEFVAILGPSGCGKTTTMNMIAGIEDASQGTIHFDDRDMTHTSMQKRGVGFVFQNYAIFTHMSVRKNLAFGLEIQGLAKPEVDRRVKEMAEFMALSHRLDQQSSSLSVNEMQKLAIGRSAIVEPSIFLLDEPLSNLDAAFRERMRLELRELQRKLGQTMIYVTHDQIEAMGLADRIAVMNHAVLQQFDTPENIYAKPANVFVARFIGAPSMNILRAHIARDGRKVSAQLGGLEADTIPLDNRLASLALQSGKQELLFGFRPETMRLADRKSAKTFAAEVSLVETVGRRRIGHFQSGLSTFVGTFARRIPLKAGEVVNIELDLDTCHFFDPDTELRLIEPEVETENG
ncbi:MAG: ABC transporter ATP-binding protein [Pseudomonadota bacterium]